MSIEIAAIEGEYMTKDSLCINGGNNHVVIPSHDGYAYCQAIDCGWRVKVA